MEIATEGLSLKQKESMKKDVESMAEQLVDTMITLFSKYSDKL
jgi:hypothetical protein